VADDDEVKTSVATPAKPRTPRRPRSRFGYDGRWWGAAARLEDPPPSYWAQARQPLASLLFVLPLLLAYELGVAWVGGASAAAVRSGADAWMRQALAAAGLTDRWLPPLSLAVVLLSWQLAAGTSWRVRPGTLLGMAVESLALAVALVGLSRLLDLAFLHLEGYGGPLLAAAPGAPDPALVRALGFLGAGVYEEALFRLLLIPLFYGALRLAQAPTVVAGTLAITASSLLFAVAHHAGSPGEPFTWYAFSFRWAAGIVFAWVFAARGFGVAVGTHAAYDLLVGSVGWLN
jgi:membrane protease YdiL (CAAX protease family)